jgi:hypothetical protein
VLFNGDDMTRFTRGLQNGIRVKRFERMHIDDAHRNADLSQFTSLSGTRY